MTIVHYASLTLAHRLFYSSYIQVAPVPSIDLRNSLINLRPGKFQVSVFWLDSEFSRASK